MSKKLILAGWLTCIAQLTFAQQPSSLPTKNEVIDVDSVTVTQSKIPLTTKETSKQVIVISSKEIQRSKGKDLAQILNEQEGILITGANSNPSSNKSVFIRGALSTYALILIDGVPVNDPSGSGGAFDLRLLPLDQIERIEILKGSQSTMYGSDAISGVINIITKRAEGKPISLSGSASVGSFKSSKGDINLSGTIGKVGYATGYSSYFTEGISDASNRDGVVEFDKDGFERQAYYAKLFFNPTKQISVQPYFRSSNYSGRYDAGAFSDANNSYQSSFINPGLTAKFSGEKFNVNALYNFNQTEREYISSSTSNFKGKLHNADVFASYKLGSKLHVVGGAFYQHTQNLDTSGTVDNPIATLVSPYLNLLLKNWHGLNVEAGARYNDHSKYGSNTSFSIAPSYWVNGNTKVFASYSTGYKVPTLSQLYGKWGANESLKPQTSSTSEIGVSTSLLNKVRVELAAFQREISNVIVYSYAKGYYNQDVQADHGGELSVNVDLLKNLSARIGYAYTNGEVRTKTSSESDTAYYNLIRRPKHAGSFGLNYKPHKQFNISVNGIYVGDRTDNFFNPNNFWIAEEVSLDAYLLLNAYLEYVSKNEAVSVFVNLKNIGSVEYAEIYGYGTPKFNFFTGIQFKL